MATQNEPENTNGNSSLLSTTITSASTTSSSATNAGMTDAGNRQAIGGNSAHAGSTNYIATSHWSTAIAASVVGNFESPNDLNLIVAKKNVLSISKVTSTGITCSTEIPVFGNIISFRKVRPKWIDRDLLLAFTNTFEVLLMSIELVPPGLSSSSTEIQYEVNVLAQGSARERARSESEAGFSFAVDPTQQYVAMHLYSGEVKIIKLPTETLLGRQQLSQTELYMQTLRVEEESIIDMCFVESPAATGGGGAAGEVATDPVLAFIYNDSSGRHLSSYTVKLTDEILERSFLDVKSIEHEACSIIPLTPNKHADMPNPGVLVIGQEAVMYTNQTANILSESLSGDVAHCRVTCHCVLDDTRWPARYLIAEGAQGSIMLLLVYKDDPHSDVVTKMHITMLGQVACTPYELVYVDAGRVFVGTEDGDSFLLRLTEERDRSTGHYFVVETVYPGLGPILDLQLVQHEKQSQAYLLACAGRRRTGTLRIIRNGVGIEEKATLDLEGIRGVWAVTVGADATAAGGGGSTSSGSNGLLVHTQPQQASREILHDMLILSFALDTKAIDLRGAEMEEITLDGLDASRQTLWCSNIERSNFILQITENSVRTIRRGSVPQLAHEWKPTNAGTTAAAGRVSHCAVFGNQIVIASGSQLIYAEIDRNSGAIEQVATCAFEGGEEAACIDIYPVGAASGNSSSSSRSGSSRLPTMPLANCAAVGTWKSQSLRIYALPEMRHLTTEDLSQSGMVPRSVKICSVDDNTTYIMVAMGDGTVQYFSIDAASGDISDRKKIGLGTQPTQLYRFDVNFTTTTTGGGGAASNMFGGSQHATDSAYRQQHVFACSDRPAIIYYSSNNKLVFANVNVGKAVKHVCSLNTPEYRRSFIMVDETQLIIGEIDQIQKLHIRTIGLRYHARRLVYSYVDNVIAICGIQEHWQPENVFLPNAYAQEVRKPPAAVNLTNSAERRHAGTTKEEDVEMKVPPSQDDALFDAGEASSSAAAAAVASTSAAAAAAAPRVASTAPAPPQPQHIVGLDTFSCFVKFYDGTTFEEKATFALQEHELVNAITTCRLGDDARTFYAVGTGLTIDDELECASGRIVLLHYRDGVVSVMAQKDVQGSVYVLRQFQNKLAATVNNTLFIFEWDPNSQDIKTECMKTLSVQAIHMKVKNDFIVIGDLMRSIIVYAYRPVEGQVEEVAQDFYPTWMSACEIIDDDLFIGATDEENILVVRSDTSAESHEERVKLKRVAIMNLGDRINQFCHGSLAMPQQFLESSVKAESPIIFGTTSGAIGVILQLPKPLFDFLKELEKIMAESVRVVGRVKHQVYRGYRTRNEQSSTFGFVDGDLVERFLDLTMKEQREVAQRLTLDPRGSSGQKPSLDETVKIVEDMSRLH